MSENNNKTSSAGIGFTGLLTIVFIVLKLTNIIKWSWLWVLSPIWISIIIAILCVLIPFILAIIAALTSSNKKDK